jgi:multidrug resistance efflux pump
MKKLKYLSTLLVAALAIIAAWLVWNYYTQSPWTRDGKVRAEQVGVTPQVSGSILQLNVRDNQLVKAGDVLFRIDDTPYKIALLNAQAQLAKAKRKSPARRQNRKSRQRCRRRRHLSRISSRQKI